MDNKDHPTIKIGQVWSPGVRDYQQAKINQAESNKLSLNLSIRIVCITDSPTQT